MRFARNYKSFATLSSKGDGTMMGSQSFGMTVGGLNLQVDGLEGSGAATVTAVRVGDTGVDILPDLDVRTFRSIRDDFRWACEEKQAEARQDAERDKKGDTE